MALSAGTRLGPYEIIAPLGVGGMGEVYRAKDHRLGREVAIKVLPEGMTDNPQSMARFEREARALAALSHPNILTIFDFHSDYSISYAVMELLEGDTLRAFVKDSAGDWRQALKIAIPMADALSAAHSKQVIHRDLKPENIFLTSDGRVKLLDFGLVHWELAPPGRADTEPGMILGTVQYMSPEQVRGEVIDSRSDIFSFGCLLYEMLSGFNPFARKSAPETMTAILRDEPAALPKTMPEGLREVVSRCLEKSAADRYQTAGEISNALKTIQEGAPTSPVSVLSERKSAFRTARVLIPLITLLVIGALILLWFLFNRPIRSLAVLPLANASGDASAEYLSDGITESIISNMSQLPELRVLAGSSVFRYKGMQVNPRVVGKELNVDAILMGKVFQYGDTLVIQADLIDARDGSEIWGQSYDRKLQDILRLQAEIAQKISDSLKIRLTGEEKQKLAKHYTDSTEAYKLYLKGRYYWNKRTAEGFQKGIEFFRQSIDTDPNYALAYAGLADSYALQGAYGVVSPADSMPLAKAAARKALDIEPDLAEAHATLALISFLYDWNWSLADSEFKSAIRAKPNYATVHHWYAEYLIAMGRSSESISEMKKARELDPLSVILTNDLGRALFFARRYDQAVEEFTRALQQDSNFAPAHIGLGLVREQQARYRQAVAEFKKAAKLSDTTGDEVLLAHALAAWGRKKEAQEILAGLHQNQPYVSPYSYACAYVALGDMDRAFAWLETAYAERSQYMAYMRVDPRLDPLHRDRRYAALMRKLRL